MSLTFSQLVDQVASETGRLDKVQSIATFANQSIRELHANERGKSIVYSKNLIEDQLTANVAEMFPWVVVQYFQSMRTVRFDNVLDCGEPVYPKMLKPGRILRSESQYYYRAGKNFFFRGYGGLNSLISIAYYTFPPLMQYFPVAIRPASYDLRSGWTYNDLTGADPVDLNFDLDDTNRALAETLTTNWMVFDWFTTVIEGTKAKLYKAQGDEDRSRTHFSQFQLYKQQLFNTEGGESLEA